MYKENKSLGGVVISSKIITWNTKIFNAELMKVFLSVYA